MSKTSSDVVDILFSYIKNSTLMSDVKKPNGKVCARFERPLNSGLEDVVINSLPINYEDVQEGVLNVNIYVPNLKLPNSPLDKKQPDTKRISELSALTKQALGEGKEVWEPSGSYCFRIQQDRIEPDENNQYYINFRIEFYLLNS